MADRWRVVPLLLKGVAYRDIHERTRVRVTTIGRVARPLERGAGGYAAAARLQHPRLIPSPLRGPPSAPPPSGRCPTAAPLPSSTPPARARPRAPCWPPPGRACAPHPATWFV